MTIFGHACLSRATSGGSTSAPTTSLAATRTTPRSSALSRLKLAAVRSSARAVLIHRLGVHPQRQRRVGRQQAGLRAGK